MQGAPMISGGENYEALLYGMKYTPFGLLLTL
jgi:hypothetical protein